MNLTRKYYHETFSGLLGLAFGRLSISPNQWTFLSLIFAFMSAGLLAAQKFLPAAGLLLVSGLLDMVDGSVARTNGIASRKGAYMDTVADRYSEGIVILGLLFASLPDFFLPVRVWLFLFFLGTMMTTYVKAAAKEKGLTEKELRGGLLGRAERLIILFIGILIATFDTICLSYTIAVLAVLSNLTALQRIGITLKQQT